MRRVQRSLPLPSHPAYACHPTWMRSSCRQRSERKGSVIDPTFSSLAFGRGRANRENRRMRTRREMLISTMTGLGVAALGIPLVRANDWRSKLATLNFGVVSSENEADRIVRYKTF